MRGWPYFVTLICLLSFSIVLVLSGVHNGNRAIPQACLYFKEGGKSGHLPRISSTYSYVSSLTTTTVRYGTLSYDESCFHKNIVKEVLTVATCIRPLDWKTSTCFGNRFKNVIERMKAKKPILPSIHPSIHTYHVVSPLSTFPSQLSKYPLER